MRKALIAASIGIVAASASAQELGGAWFVTKGNSQPVALVPVTRVDDLFGLSWLDLDLSLMVRPTDGVRLGGAATVGFALNPSRTVLATIGVGGLAGDRFEWSSVRPGLVFGVAVRF